MCLISRKPLLCMLSIVSNGYYKLGGVAVFDDSLDLYAR